jgi:putative ABC transport system ATP-binding protein
MSEVRNVGLALKRPTINVSNLRKTFRVGPVRVHALRGVSLSVDKGEFVSVVGPSGCGKSTLLNMLGALDKPSHGKVVIDGINLTKLNDTKLARFRNLKVGIIFQTYNLINRTTVINNIELPAMVNGTPSNIRRRKALQLLRIVGIEEMAYRKPIEMSGGQQQRVAVARALINDPAIILADEPTGNLDSKTGRGIMQLLSKLNNEEKVTIVMVTHNLDYANEAGKIIHLKDGIVEKIVKKN